MKLKLAFFYFCLTLVLTTRTNEASAAVINFDELGPDFTLYTSIDYADVSFSNSAGKLQVRNLFPGPPFSVPNVIIPEQYSIPGNRNRATFVNGLDIDLVSVVLGDFNDDADDIFLNAYDSNDMLLASTQDLLPESLFGGHTLSLSANGISYVEFWGQGSNNNTVYFDNFAYRTKVAPGPGAVVPEPATLAMFSLGLLGLAFRKK